MVSHTLTHTRAHTYTHKCVITQQMNYFYALNDNKILLVMEGMRVDVETVEFGEGGYK